MKKIFLYSLALGMLSLGFTSCNDDEDQMTDTRVTHFAQLDLLGDDLVEINVGDTYKEPGFVATEAGEDISEQLFTEGYYYQVEDPGASVRAERGTPIISVWYTYGGSVNKLNIPLTALM